MIELIDLVGLERVANLLLAVAIFIFISSIVYRLVTTRIKLKIRRSSG